MIWGHDSRLFFTPSREQNEIARWVAEQRNSARISERCRSFSATPENSAEMHRQGVTGEMGVADYLGRPFVAWSYLAEKARHYDIGCVQVKTRPRSDGDLGLMARHCRDCIYVLLVPHAITSPLTLRFAGWATGSEVFSHAEPDRHGVWYLPQSRLRPVPAIAPDVFYAGHDLADTA